jgi:hypothetical protein
MRPEAAAAGDEFTAASAAGASAAESSVRSRCRLD